jgi:hypothetical protein
VYVLVEHQSAENPAMPLEHEFAFLIVFGGDEETLVVQRGIYYREDIG